jgi:predicted nuclease of predicted toxin-antitoxin system
MRILANVNVPRATVEALRLAGHDVVWALERMATDADFKILAAAQQDSRVVLTNYKDFGELAVRSGLPAGCGVILLRLKGLMPHEVVARTTKAIASRTDCAGNFAVVSPHRIRMRPLPTNAKP